MLFRNSIKSVVRTPAKTILFSLLLIAITAFLCLGVGMWRSSDRLLKQADETFKTTALLEYIGLNYPGEPGDDEFMAKDLENYDFSVFSGSQYVISSDRNIELGGYVEGLKVSPAALQPYKHTAVILFTPKYDTPDGLRCMIQTAYYASDDYYDGVSFYVTLSDKLSVKYPNVNFELGKNYLAVGRFVAGAKRAKVFVIHSLESPAFPEYFNRYCEFPVMDVSDIDNITTNGYTAPFMRLAEAYAAENTFFRIYATDDIESFMEFRNNELSLTSGRFFTEEEYAAQSKSIIISDHVSKQLGLELGDKIDISLVSGFDGEPAYNCYWPETGFSDKSEYTIVGMFKEMYGYHYTAFIPKPIAEWMPEATISYTLMRMRLVNGTTDELIEELGDNLLRNMRLTVYDQGYSEAAAALKTVKDSAQSLTLICGLCAFAIVLLFAYMYIAKQQNSVRIMLALGTGRGRTSSYLMIGVTLLALIAVCIGAVVGYYASGEVMNEAYAKAVAERTTDLRFSNVYLLGDTIEFNTSMEMDITDPLIAAGAIFGSTLLFSLIMASNTISSDRTRLGGSSKKGRGKGGRKATLRSTLYPIMLAWRSITRNGAKSVVVPLVSICMAVLMCVFCAQLNQYQKDLDDVYDNMQVMAYLTSVNGKSIDKLALYDLEIAPIMETGYIKQANYTTTMRYQNISLIEHEGTRTGKAGGFVPPGGYGYETFYDSINSLEKLVFTSNIYTVPEFFFDEKIDIDFMPGYNASIFQDDYEAGNGPVPCLVTQEYLNKNGYSLGDLVRISAFEAGNDMQILYRDIDIKLVGTYPKLSGTDSIYMPISASTRMLSCIAFENYQVRGLVKHEGELVEDTQSFVMPEGEAYDDLCHSILSMDRLYYTDYIESMPDYSLEGASPEYLSGYDAYTFSGWQPSDETGPKICIMPRAMMANIGASLGDTVRLTSLWRDSLLAACYADNDYTIVGTYNCDENTVFVPTGAADYEIVYFQDSPMYTYLSTDTKLYDDKELAPNTLTAYSSDDVHNWYVMLRYNSVSFTLKNLRDLNGFKDKLDEMGLSTVGKISRVRTFMVIDDQVFMDSVTNLTRNIEYMNILYVAIYAISIGIGFIVSYLLTKTRKPEFAIMRSMGTSKSKTFTAFFVEQMLLCIFGIALAVIGSVLFYGDLSELQLNSVLGYFGCYIVGIAIAIFAMNKTNVLQILTARE